jgi:hypothetical protein
MALTKEQIKEFKEKEEKAKACYELKEVADDIAKAGDKEWANKIYKSVTSSYDDGEDISDFTNRLCDELKDAEWSTKSKEELEKSNIWAFGGPQFVKIVENIIFRLTNGKYSRICVPLDKEEIYIVDTSNNLMETSNLNLVARDHINLAISLAKTEILKLFKS